MASVVLIGSVVLGIAIHEKRKQKKAQKAAALGSIDYNPEVTSVGKHLDRSSRKNLQEPSLLDHPSLRHSVDAPPAYDSEVRHDGRLDVPHTPVAA